MYLGGIVERANKENLFARPRHPYTEALISAVPEPDPDRRNQEIILEGEIPSPANPPSGCKFHTRCPKKIGAICETTAPLLRPVSAAHEVCCHLFTEAARPAPQPGGADRRTPLCETPVRTGVKNLAGRR